MALLVVLLIAALIFGIGGLIKGLFWLAFVGLALIGLTVVLGYFGITRRR